MFRSKRLALGASAAAVVVLLGVWFSTFPLPTGTLPQRYSDAEFWALIEDLSEPGGYFRSDNFVSNETNFQHVIPELRRRTQPGGVYLGVGPDQNFTYIAALQPRVAFVLDIRRQNLLQHLMYKALFEISDDRIEFLSNLFSRPVPDGLAPNSSPETMLESFIDAEPSRATFLQNQEGIIKRLTEEHGFPLDSDDQQAVKTVYRAFYTAGPEIRYSFPSQDGWQRFPTYTDLMLEEDLDGLNRSYLATEENYQFVKMLQEENRIVPLVGDFAGDHALRALGEYLDNHGAAVTAFYTSNVEFYLFQSDAWKRFYRNVEAMPIDGNSTFIRSDFGNFRNRFPFFGRTANLRSRSLLDNISALLAAFREGQVRSYDDVIWRSYEP